MMDYYNLQDLQDPITPSQQDFEPISRPRSNTWPLPRPDPLPSSEYTPPPTLPEEELLEEGLSTAATGPTNLEFGPGQKKSTSRRNAWGNLSYADLITQAIQSSPENRLTLSQIYDWMVTNVAYFKDKGDSNSSAGWKNSIRHNLSLHNRFMRVQNEGTGKSSWWMLNPDARPGKAARRRATTLETSKYEKKRGRIKKRVEQMRNGGSPDGGATGSLSEGLDLYSAGVEEPAYSPLQPNTDFRPRASSNASSIGLHSTNSRLSPLLDDQLQFYSGYFAPDRFGAEALAASLGPMKLQEQSPQYGSEFGQQTGQQLGPFRSHSFGVSSPYTRPTHLPSSSGGASNNRQQSPQQPAQPPPHSSSIDQLLFPTTVQANSYNPFQQSLFQDIKPDMDFNLEHLEPSFTSQVDEEVLRRELMGSELLEFGGFLEAGGGQQGQQQQFGQQQMSNTATPTTTIYNQSPQLLEQQSQAAQQGQLSQGRQWVH